MRFWTAIATVVAVYLLIIKFNPARASLRKGYQYLRRHPFLGIALLIFYLANALYETTLQGMGAWHWKWTPVAAETAANLQRTSGLAALDRLADLFLLCFPAAPLAALGALLFLFGNWLRLHETLIHHLRMRKRPLEWFLYGGLLLSALAAIVQPLAAYGSVSRLRYHVPGLLLIHDSVVVASLAFLFEILFGVAVQLYLIHCVALWIRNQPFNHREVMAEALPQAWPVLQWAAVIALLKLGLVVLPERLCHTPPVDQWLHPRVIATVVENGTRPLLAVLLIAAASFQATLAFQSRTLKGAFRDHYRFLRQHGWEAVWFLLVAYLHFFAAELLHHIVALGLKQGGALLHLWRLVCTAGWAFLGAWLLAAWICLFRQSALHRKEDDDPQNLETLRREDWIAPI